MKAAVLYGTGDIRIEERPQPTADTNEVVLKVKAAGICGSDLHLFKSGDLSVFRNKPSVLGHEFSGEVVEFGPEVKGLKVGDRMLGNGRRSCGYCSYCLQGETNQCAVTVLPGWGLDGAFAEYVVVPNPALGEQFFHIPERLDWEDAATVEPFSVALRAVDTANIQPAETVLVMGAGMIGQGVVQLCKARGAGKVIVSEP